MMESRSPSVLDTPLSRSMTIFARSDSSAVAQRRRNCFDRGACHRALIRETRFASRNAEWGTRFSDNGDVTTGELGSH
jgi:hypothetical protein